MHRVIQLGRLGSLADSAIAAHHTQMPPKRLATAKNLPKSQDGRPSCPVTPNAAADAAGKILEEAAKLAR